jgi:superfamily I DNA/RNA helicase
MTGAPARISVAPGGAPDQTLRHWPARLHHLWLLTTFKAALDVRQSAAHTLHHLEHAIDLIFRNPNHPHLTVTGISSYDVPLFIVAAAPAIISAPEVAAPPDEELPVLVATTLSAGELGLLTFDTPANAAAWIERVGGHVRGLLQKVTEVRPDGGLRAMPLPLPARDKDAPIALASAQQFRRMVAEGVARYLTWLDDDQRALVNLRSGGLLLMKGGAGTGKTSIAIHRILDLARQPTLVGPRKVLYLCFNQVLSRVVAQLLASLSHGGLPEDVEVRTFHSWCGEFTRRAGFPSPDVDEDACKRAVARAFGHLSPDRRQALAGLNSSFVYSEIEQVILRNGISEEEDYLTFPRKGRGTQLRQAAREAIWQIHAESSAALAQAGAIRYDDVPVLALNAIRHLREVGRAGEVPQYRAVVIDEAQDCSPVMIRIARQLLVESGGQLTVLADPAQNIYESGWQWTQAELKVRGGDTRWLRKNYRTTRQIFALAHPLIDGHEDLADELAHLDAPTRDGPSPTMLVGPDEGVLLRMFTERVQEAARRWQLNQIGVLAPSRQDVDRVAAALHAGGVLCRTMDPGRESVPIDAAGVKIVTIHSAKGLDFPAVFVWGPHRSDLGGTSRASLPETRRLLYVGLTRAGSELTLAVAAGHHHPLVTELPAAHYVLLGDDVSRARMRAGGERLLHEVTTA